MPRRSVLLVMLAVAGVACGFALLLRGYNTPFASASTQARVVDEEPIWRAFASHDDKRVTKRQALLRETAMHRAQTDPAVARKAWQAILARRGKSDLGHASLVIVVQAISELLLFQDTLAEAITRSESGVDLREALDIYEAVDRDINAHRERVSDALYREITSLGTTLKSNNDIQERLRRHLEFASKSEVRNAFSALIATMPEQEGDPVLERVLALEATITLLLRKRAHDMHAEVKKYAEDLTSRTVEPEYDAKEQRFRHGRAEQLLEELSELVDLLEQIDLDAWRRARVFAMPSGHQPTDTASAATEEELLKAQHELQQTQFLAYNLWALREIDAAETGHNWEGRMARIDPGILAPAVAIVYSSVQSRRLEAERDPHRRGVKIRVLLTPSRVPLSAF